MKIQEIFNLAIKMGIKADLSSEQQVNKFLERKRKEYERTENKEEFDKESLENPYLDSRIYNIVQDIEIKKILTGIDIAPAEILMAKTLGEIDLVIAHHPIGKGLANLADEIGRASCRERV